MACIKKLDQSTILKLAAGEIIDRPVSIVKELVENSIDSGATSIKVFITQGGIAEIQIVDNGCGIATEDMASTIEPHATSKLVDFDDLETVMTMGFRGEALASISEVADVTILSYNEEDELGSELIKMAGQGMSLNKKAREKGTTITVAHLFKKVPVRFRFLKSPTSEGTLITRLMQQFSLHYPSIQFELKNNNVEVLSTPGNHQLMDQFSHALTIKKEDVLPFHKVSNGITVSGVMTSPNKTFKQRAKCWFSVNGRMVKSPLFFRAIDQALTDIIPKQTYPALVCNIECNSQDVDINIHPKKEDVKFTNQDAVFIAIKRAIQSGVYQPAQTWRDALDAVSNNPLPPISASRTDIKPLPKEVPASPMGLHEHLPTISTRNNSLPNRASSRPQSVQNISQERKDATKQNDAPPIAEKKTTTHHAPSLMTTNQEIQWVTFKNKYIIVPLDSDVLVFDQHAVHERILYDQFKKDCDENAVVSMPLLMPEYIAVNESDVDGIKDLIPLIRSLGIDFDVFDESSFILREVPQFFSTVNVGAWVSSLLSTDALAELENESLEEKKAMIQMKACKAAVKAGQRLHDMEVRALIQSCLDSKTQFTCPHGRPLYIKMSESQLDALFLRS